MTMPLDRTQHAERAPKERITHVLEHLHEGINLKDPYLIGLRGVSMYDVEFLIKTGYLPTSVDLERRPKNPRETYFAPIIEHLPGEWLPGRFEGTSAKQYKLVKGYAEEHAKRHAMMLVLGIPLWDKLEPDEIDFFEYNHEGMRKILENDPPHPFVVKYGKESIEGAIVASEKAKGVILGLSKTALGHYPIVKMPGREGDYFLHTPRGVALRHLNGIAALGKEEKAFFRDIERARFGDVKPFFLGR